MTRSAGGKKRVLLSALAAMALGTLSCDDSPTGPAPTYPTTYAQLSELELSGLTAQFEDANPGFCEALDAYGFVKEVSPCVEDPGPVTCSNLNQLIQRAKVEVVRNHLFTGVRRFEELQVRTSQCADFGYYPRVVLRFEDQRWNGLEVFGTEMLVHMNDDGMLLLAGHHYPQIFVPSPAVSSEAAKTSIVGMKVTGPDGLQEYCIEEDWFVGEPFRVIYPYQVGDRIELRVTWSINVANTWMVYVDSVTGEAIAVRPLLIA
jgi:hypothetical protein